MNQEGYKALSKLLVSIAGVLFISAGLFASMIFSSFTLAHTSLLSMSTVPELATDLASMVSLLSQFSINMVGILKWALPLGSSAIVISLWAWWMGYRKIPNNHLNNKTH